MPYTVLPAPESGRSENGRAVTVAVTSSSTPALPANPLRTEAVYWNSGSALIVLGFGFVPTATNGVPVPAGAVYEPRVNFVGAVNVISPTSSTLVATELT